MPIGKYECAKCAEEGKLQRCTKPEGCSRHCKGAKEKHNKAMTKYLAKKRHIKKIEKKEIELTQATQEREKRDNEIKKYNKKIAKAIKYKSESESESSSEEESSSEDESESSESESSSEEESESSSEDESSSEE